MIQENQMIPRQIDMVSRNPRCLPNPRWRMIPCESGMVSSRHLGLGARISRWGTWKREIYLNVEDAGLTSLNRQEQLAYVRPSPKLHGLEGYDPSLETMETIPPAQNFWSFTNVFVFETKEIELLKTFGVSKIFLRSKWKKLTCQKHLDFHKFFRTQNKRNWTADNIFTFTNFFAIPRKSTDASWNQKDSLVFENYLNTVRILTCYGKISVYSTKDLNWRSIAYILHFGLKWVHSGHPADFIVDSI